MWERSRGATQTPPPTPAAVLHRWEESVLPTPRLGGKEEPSAK